MYFSHSVRLGFVLLLAPLGCSRAPAPPPDAAPVVRIVQPQQRDVTDYAYFTGRLEAIESVEVQARATGYLVSIDFKPGMPVKAKQRLFQIDPRPYKAELDKANAQVALSKAQLKLAIANNARAKEVAKTPGAISQQDVDRYQAAEDEAAASVTAAEAAAEVAALNLSFTNVLSPVDGVVSRNLYTIGNLVKQDVTLLTTVVSQDPIYAYFEIDENTMLRAERLIREGKIKTNEEGTRFPVEFGLADEGNVYPHDGYIDFVDNQVDPSTGTLQLRGVFPNPELKPGGPRLLRPGQFVRIRLPMGAPHEALLIPQAAIGSDQGKKYLLTVNEDNIVQYAPITSGPQQAGGLQVIQPAMIHRTSQGVQLATSGEQGKPSVTKGSRVIVDGLQHARPGVKVDPKPVEHDPTAPLETDAPDHKTADASSQ